MSLSDTVARLRHADHAAEVEAEERCERCDGRGRLERGDYAYPCPECGGHGTLPDPDGFREPDEPPEPNAYPECAWDAPY